ncbi:ABC transporter ATP-binding protein [Limnobacter parvus]|uniref:ABC transporter ATP-binding protein n=1 Tax=Limnobacter parvus TaxID=2939690 RepID=A0ABT1XKW6_9BURK|nr:ABC transporter ATP-binding protein [Limnobacter parvus]MCR2747504.1 ABC transporter ATP-binding protein [Limnobacter parvus]
MKQIPALSIENLSILYPGGDAPAVRDVSFELAQGEIACLLGPSGCGKTTLLRAIAGFLMPSNGMIKLKGEKASEAGRVRSPENRNVGVVFQDYALFPHLSVRKNIEFGLHKRDEPEKKQRSGELLALIGLEALADRYPHELSGGQQQRVALARALAPKPTLILLDEPFSNLDVELKERLTFEVREILKAENMSAILVTHDQHEAFSMADRIGVMHAGELQQWGSSYSLYHQPNSRMVADFIGQGVFLPGRKTELGLQIELAHLRLTEDQLPSYDEFDVLIRPDDIIHDDASPMQAKVVRKAFRGADFLYTLELESGVQVLALVPSHHNHAIGEPIGIKLELDHVITFDRI